MLMLKKRPEGRFCDVWEIFVSFKALSGGDSRKGSVTGGRILTGCYYIYGDCGGRILQLCVFLKNCPERESANVKKVVTERLKKEAVTIHRKSVYQSSPIRGWNSKGYKRT